MFIFYIFLFYLYNYISSLDNTLCDKNLDVLWKNTIDTSIYNDGIIYEYFESKYIIITTNNGLLSLLDADGHHIPNTPIYVAEKKFYISPILSDINNDGINEILWLSGDGKLYILEFNGISLNLLPTIPTITTTLLEENDEIEQQVNISTKKKIKKKK